MTAAPDTVKDPAVFQANVITEWKGLDNNIHRRGYNNHEYTHTNSAHIPLSLTQSFKWKRKPSIVTIVAINVVYYYMY